MKLRADEELCVADFWISRPLDRRSGRRGSLSVSP